MQKKHSNYICCNNLDPYIHTGISGYMHFKVSAEESSSVISDHTEVQSESLIYASALCRAPDRLCDWILAHLRVYVCIVPDCVCGVLIAAQLSVLF